MKPMTETETGLANVAAEIQERLNAMMPREARWAYWQKNGGPMFVYNTERISTEYPDDPANGRFESAVFVPYGPGSRSGKAQRWRVLDESRSLHDLRKDAKARAYRLYQTWRETGRVDV
jgi:hypothetical protein